ncbi:MAG: ATP-binding protein, partial [Gammaproteobacteria bacterium SHHR-1]
PDGSVQLVQVCESLRVAETRTRELRALTKALQECGETKGLVITQDERDHLQLEDLEIDVMPAWRWMID